jgi:hypothetical protein
MHKIDNSKENITQMIKDLFITPRDLMNKWSLITHQTAQVRLAYPGQHLASIITGIPGVGTAARGDDLIDGTEVKSCSRADQLGICKNCSARVMRQFNKCPICDSSDIEIKEDSHWIFSIQSENELKLLLGLPRILFILFDRDNEKFIRIRMWQVTPKNEYVRLFFKDYFFNNYQKKARGGNTKIAPCNLHPLKYDFLMMSPVLLFHSVIKENNIEIRFLDLKNKKSEIMPTSLLNPIELKIIKETLPQAKIKLINSKNEFIKEFPFLTDKQKFLLKMRVKKIKKNTTSHVRSSQKD